MPEQTWQKAVPPEDGWYWIRYKGVHEIIECPCSVGWAGDLYVVRTADNKMFNKNNLPPEARFHPDKIEPPS